MRLREKVSRIDKVMEVNRDRLYHGQGMMRLNLTQIFSPEQYNDGDTRYPISVLREMRNKMTDYIDAKMLELMKLD